MSQLWRGRKRVLCGRLLYFYTRTPTELSVRSQWPSQNLFKVHTYNAGVHIQPSYSLMDLHDTATDTVYSIYDTADEDILMFS